jgi:hypothetical protein
MAKGVGKLKIFGIGAGTLVIVVGIIVGILFATGVIKIPSTGSSQAGGKLGPGASNPGAGTPISVTLSNIQIEQGSGTPGGVSFNISLNPDPSSLGINNATLNTSAVLTFSDGTTSTITNSNYVNQNTVSGINWQNQIHGLGIVRTPKKVDVSAYCSYSNSFGTEVTGPVSNTVSVNIPTS